MVKKRKSLSFAGKEERPSSSSSKLKPTPPPLESESDPEDDSSDDDSEEENNNEQQSSNTSDSDEEDESESNSEFDYEGSKREAIKILLDSFGKDQLIAILREAATANPSLVAGIANSVESDPIHRKIFVHGLSWDTTAETLTSFFAQYGIVEGCKVVRDKTTGRSKGGNDYFAKERKMWANF